MIELLNQLCSLNGVSSYEDDVRAFIMKEIEPYVESMRVDTMGNLIAYKKGASAAKKKLLLSAHMDEVGMMVRAVTDGGYLKFDFVGGVDRKVVLGKHVVVGENRVPGVVGVKAVHLTTKEERKSVPKTKDLVIDIGADSKEEALALVKLGDVACFTTKPELLGEKYYKAKAIDDRFGCAVLISLIKQELPVDCTFVFVVQEEVGTRGAFGVGFSEKPDYALILESTTAADIPEVENNRKVCAPGKGPVIMFIDGGTIYDKQLYSTMTKLADKNGIRWQTKEYISGGTDARTYQRSCNGTRVAGLSIACRYLHSPSSVAHVDDMENVLKLAGLFIDKIAEEII